MVPDPRRTSALIVPQGDGRHRAGGISGRGDRIENPGMEGRLPAGTRFLPAPTPIQSAPVLPSRERSSATFSSRGGSHRDSCSFPPSVEWILDPRALRRAEAGSEFIPSESQLLKTWMLPFAGAWPNRQLPRLPGESGRGRPCGLPLVDARSAPDALCRRSPCARQVCRQDVVASS